MTKQELIQQAYGRHFDEKRVDADGWTYQKDYPLNRHMDVEYKGRYFRPLTLQGIETNNGWTKIESDRSNLTTGIFEFLVAEDYNPTKKPKIEVVHVNDALIKHFDMVWDVYSHYRPIKEDLLPLY